MTENVFWFSYKVPFILFCPILMTLELSPQIVDKYSNTNFMKIRPVGSELFHVERGTNGHDKVNSRFSQFCERA